MLKKKEAPVTHCSIWDVPQSQRCSDTPFSVWLDSWENPSKMRRAMKKQPPTCPWLRSWKRAVPSVSGRTTTARAGTRARWHRLHSVTLALVPSRHSSWKSRERNRWAQEERLLPETRQNVLKESAGADASGSKPALSLTCTCGTEHTSPEHLWTIPDAQHILCIFVVL